MATLVTTASGAPAANGQPAKYPTHYRPIAIDGLSIFYREAGPKDGPTIPSLLLGFSLRPSLPPSQSPLSSAPNDAVQLLGLPFYQPH